MRTNKGPSSWVPMSQRAAQSWARAGYPIQWNVTRQTWEAFLPQRVVYNGPTLFDATAVRS